MTKKRFVSVLYVVMVCCSLSWAGSSSSWASQVSDPMSLLKKTQKQLTEVIERDIGNDEKSREQQDKDIRKIVEPFFDFAYLAQKALGEHWEKCTQEERKKYLFWVEAMVKHVYLKSLRTGAKDKAKVDAKIRYLKQTIKSNDATVFTRVEFKDPKTNKRQRVRVDWTFLKQNGRWMVVDLITNDNSLIEQYQEQFDKIIKKHSFTELLNRIKKKVHQLRKDEKLPLLEDPK